MLNSFSIWLAWHSNGVSAYEWHVKLALGIGFAVGLASFMDLMYTKTNK